MKHWLKIIVCALIFALLFVLFGYAFKFESSQKRIERDAMNISSECVGDKRVECLDTKIGAYISHYPERTGALFDAFLHLEDKKVLVDDPRIFSSLVHDAGMVLVDNNIPLDKAAVFCGTAFRDGCIHGVVMEYIDNTYPKTIDPAKMFDLCTSISHGNQTIYINCLHGVGHELAAKNNPPVQTILSLCNPLVGEERDACASGVLMEYSKGTAGSGSHSDEPVWTIALPCADLEQTYQPICYASADLYRHFEPGT